MDQSKQERRAKREERGDHDKRDTAAVARMKGIRARLDELAAERTKLKEELQALRGPEAADESGSAAE